MFVTVEYIKLSSELLERNRFPPAMICPRGKSPQAPVGRMIEVFRV